MLQEPFLRSHRRAAARAPASASSRRRAAALGHWVERLATTRSAAIRSSRRPPGISRRATPLAVPGPLEQALVGTRGRRRRRDQSSRCSTSCDPSIPAWSALRINRDATSSLRLRDLSDTQQSCHSQRPLARATDSARNNYLCFQALEQFVAYRTRMAWFLRTLLSHAAPTSAAACTRTRGASMGAAIETFYDVIRRQGITRRSFIKFCSLTATSLGLGPIGATRDRAGAGDQAAHAGDLDARARMHLLLGELHPLGASAGQGRRAVDDLARL